MTDLNNADFYRRRKRQERVLADRAHDAEIRAIHLELADRYVGLAERAGVERVRHRAG